jgi:hypothetical protein
MYNNVSRGKHLSGKSPIQNGLKQVDALSVITIALEYAIRKVQENQVGCWK